MLRDELLQAEMNMKIFVWHRLADLVASYGEPAFALVKRLAERSWETPELHIQYLSLLTSIARGTPTPL